MQKFTQEQINKIEDVLEIWNDWDFEQLYRDMLTDVYGPAQVGGYEYDHAVALETVDPTAYRVGLADYHSTLLEEYTEYMPGQYVRTDELEQLFEEQESA